MLTVNKLSKTYGIKTVLVDVSFGVNAGDRIGLIGTNGSGKSTLLKILVGLESIDSGKVTPSSSVRIGYLPQIISGSGDETIDSLLARAVKDISEIKIRLQKLEAILALNISDRTTETLMEYSRLLDRYSWLGGYDINSLVETTFKGLGIASISRSRNINTLSGGEKTRLNLAVTLLHSPNLLLLDEPTNNLDFQSLEWLEHYLADYKGAMLIASHDRQFLNNVVNSVFEIDDHSHKLKQYSGNYDAYLAAKQVERTKWEADYQEQQQEIIALRKAIGSTKQAIKNRSKTSRDSDKFIRYFKEQRVQKSSTRAIRNAEERLKRIENSPIPKPPKPLRFRPPDKLRAIRSAEVISVIHVTKSYGNNCVLDDINFNLKHDTRLVITGPNGSGKSTLLKILAGEGSGDGGTVKYAPSVRIGYLPQEPAIEKNEQAVIDYFRNGLIGYDEDFVFDLVTCGLFEYDDLKKPIGQLSLGQIRKLQIARLIAEEPNVLILDEPTNHLSLDILESFENALHSFLGPVLAVSHDRRFIKQFGVLILEIRKGQLTIKTFDNLSQP